MVNSYRKLIFNVYLGFYCTTIILPKISICSQSSMPSSKPFSKDPGAFPEATNREPFPWYELRLPNTVIPHHYDLLVYPNCTSLEFVASENIEVLVRNATLFIILHSKDLEITNVTLYSEEDSRYRKPGEKLSLSYPAHQQIALLVPEKLVAGLRCHLAIDFQVKLADGFKGFYKSTRTLGGETRTIAVTDFEPVDAQMAFPCFDERLFKANFLIKIKRESKHIALSNMPKVKTIELEGGLLEDHFETTVKMSTYPIVCDFTSVSGTTSSEVKPLILINISWVSIYVCKNKWNQTRYALEASLNLLDFYKNYFDINYPLSELDLMAIPDFGSGAMKNWGLITFKESLLLVDPKTSSANEELWVLTTVARELAHQDNYFLEFEIIKKHYNSSCPISNQAETPTQIQEMFDTVFYNKGASILNMLKDFLSEEKFQKGTIHYLKKFSYGNIKNGYLWSSLSNSCLEDDFTSGEFCYFDSKRTSDTLILQGENEIKERTATWTLQKGIPLVVVEREGRLFRLRRFLSSVSTGDPGWQALQERVWQGLDEQTAKNRFSGEETARRPLTEALWHVPWSCSMSSSNAIHGHILKSKTDTLDLPENTSWVKFNVNSNGYYVVQYVGPGWDQFITQLNQNHTLFSPKDRIGLIHGVFQLIYTKHWDLFHISVQEDKAFDWTHYLQHETNILALLKGQECLELFYHMMDRRNISDVNKNLKHYLLQYFKPVIDTQSWSNEGSFWDRMHRAALPKLACNLNHAPCIWKATELFPQWKESSRKLNIPTDILKIVFSMGAWTIAGWNYLLEKYKLSVSSAEKHKFLYALSASKYQEKFMKLILGMEGEIIKTQDLALLHAIARNPKGQRLAWNFVKQNWTHLLKKLVCHKRWSSSSQREGEKHLCKARVSQESQSSLQYSLTSVVDIVIGSLSTSALLLSALFTPLQSGKQIRPFPDSLAPTFWM
ncbi:LOW QUALITY PROTEIN: endoplasmic reticulum aminopeptidase 2-like [Rhynchonycteris naso]